MIYINSTLRINQLDKYNLQLEEYKEGKDAPLGKATIKWRRVGYYGDLKSALLGALSKQLFDCAKNEMTIKEVIAKIDEARAEIVQAVQGMESKKE